MQRRKEETKSWVTKSWGRIARITKTGMNHRGVEAQRGRAAAELNKLNGLNELK
jgi:hypothetical protein